MKKGVSHVIPIEERTAEDWLISVRLLVQILDAYAPQGSREARLGRRLRHALHIYDTHSDEPNP